ncbi:MAG: ABC transporter ATP-binding protein [Lachnospiraceae bacterium]|nr:ABC transporter ATP-binding protein [Lachnospiraceae bacterium]
MEYMMQCDHITKWVGNFALKDISFTLKPGYILAVIGHNGAGKSTLVRTMLGSYKLYDHMEDCSFDTAETRRMAANKGDIYVEGYSLRKNGRAYKQRIGYVLNECPFHPRLTVHKTGEYYGSFYEGFDQMKYLEFCKAYGISDKHLVGKLSKGERIKLQLAFAQSYGASLYIMDEPAGSLDVKFRRVLYDLMRELIAAGDKSIIFVTHLVEEIENMADYLLWLEDGGQQFFGTAEELFDQYRIYSGSVKLEELSDGQDFSVVGKRMREFHQEYFIRLNSERCSFSKEISRDCRRAALTDIMYYVEEARIQKMAVCRE